MHSIPGYRAKYFYEHCLYLKEFTLPALRQSLAQFLEAAVCCEETHQGSILSNKSREDTNDTDSNNEDPS